MDRLPDWKPRLIAWLASIAGTPFEPGKHDCALFVAGAIEAMTGEDPAARFRGRYTTVRGGLRVIRAEGFGDHVDMVSSRLEEVAPLMAQVGDIAVVDTPRGLALGVVAGAEILVLGLHGLGAVSLLEGKRAFKLPSGGA
jgi:hypothetical protein